VTHEHEIPTLRADPGVRKVVRPLNASNPRRPERRNRGFTLIEVLVSLTLVGVLGSASAGLIFPLRLGRQATSQAQALTVARSYLETARLRWRTPAGYASGASVLPAASGVGLPAGWVLDTPGSQAWTGTDAVRTLSVRVGPAVVSGQQDRRVTLSTMVAAP
jgi:prepilin-type N-terminal cleavage/methylation domain-containing protein